MKRWMCIDGQTDRWMNGWREGWVDGRMGIGVMGGRMDGDWWRDGWADRRTDGWVYEGIMDGPTILSDRDGLFMYYNDEVLGEKHPLV